MERPRSLLLVKHRIPSPIEIGSDAVSYALVRALADDFALTFVAVESGERSEQGAEQLRSIGVETVLVPRDRGLGTQSNVMGSLVRNARLVLRGVPRLLQSQACSSLAPTLKRLSSERRYALAQFEYWTTVPYRRYAQCPAALLNHDAWHRTIEDVARYEPSPLYRLLWKTEAAAIRRFEASARSNFDWSLYLSENDRPLTADDELNQRVRVIPVPFPFEPKKPEGNHGTRKPTVVFVGAMNVDFNVDGVRYFADHIWPEIHQRVPDATFLIVGRHPSDRVVALERYPGIRIESHPPDIDAILHQCSVAVSPARFGTGIKVKVAQALAAGLPVVGTPAGLSGFDHADCLVRPEHEHAFADAVVRLLVNHDYRRSVGQASGAFYREQLWVEAARPRLVALYTEMIAAVEAPAIERAVAPPAISDAG